MHCPASLNDNHAGSGDGDEVGSPHFVVLTLDNVLRGRAGFARQIRKSRIVCTYRFSFSVWAEAESLSNTVSILVFLAAMEVLGRGGRRGGRGRYFIKLASNFDLSYES